MRFSQVYLCCFGWFCVEYLYFEDVHTFTYDIFAGEIRAGAFLFCVVHHVVFSSSHYAFPMIRSKLRIQNRPEFPTKEGLF